jgi:hypothetical protein
MIRLVTVAVFALALATSAQAMSLAPFHQADGMVTQVRELCGAGYQRIRGVCVRNTTVRQVRRCARGMQAFALYGTETPTKLPGRTRAAFKLLATSPAKFEIDPPAGAHGRVCQAFPTSNSSTACDQE